MSEVIKENMTEEFNADTYLEALEAELFKDDETITENADETPSKEFVIDCLEFAMNFDDDSDDGLFTEGFNNDLKKQYKQDVKEIRQIMKKIKKHTKDDLDYNAAIDALEKLEAKIDKMIANIKSEEGDTAATIVGMLYRGFIGFMKTFAAALVTLPIGGVGAWIVAIEHDIRNIMGIYTRIMDRIRNKEDLDIDDFNLFKNALITSYVGYKKKVNKLKVELQRKADAEKSAKEDEVKEKVNDIFEQEKLKLYEACSAGEITEEQREDLINRFRLTSKVEESVQVNNINEDYSKKDAFELVKKDIYERCAKGEFDIDTREDLVKEAYQRFMEGEDSVDKIVDSVKKQSTLDQDIKKLVNDINQAAKDPAATE